MPSHATVTGLPVVEINEIFDPTTANATFEFLEQDLVQLPSTSSLKARQVVVRLNGCILIYYATNVRVRTRPTLQHEYNAYICYGPQAHGTLNGLPVRDDVMLAVPAGGSIAMVAEPGYESATILVRPQELAGHLSTRGRDELIPVLQQNTPLHVGQQQAAQLFGWCRQLVDAVVEYPTLFNDQPLRCEAARQDLLDMLGSTLSQASQLSLQRRERTRQLQSDIVRTAERHALANTHERLYVKDLCQAAAVSERSLEYAFRAEMGLSPVAYLTRLRLHRVREGLLRSTGDTTVTEEALRWGFWHFGEFAKAYKECFQELPSDTLRRSEGRSAD